GSNTWPSERVQQLERFPVEHQDASRAPASHIQKTLPRFCREGQAGSRMGVITTLSNHQAPPIYPGLRQELSIPREPLDALCSLIGNIHQPVIRDFDGVNTAELWWPRIFRVELLGKFRGETAIGLLPIRISAPLPTLFGGRSVQGD